MPLAGGQGAYHVQPLALLGALRQSHIEVLQELALLLDHALEQDLEGPQEYMAHQKEHFPQCALTAPSRGCFPSYTGGEEGNELQIGMTDSASEGPRLAS